MIKTEELTKIFRTDEVETTALNKVTLEVQKADFVAIMGPSGCGKSTLLNIVGLLDNPTNGLLYFDDIEVSKFKERQRTNLRREIIVRDNIYCIDRHASGHFRHFTQAFVGIWTDCKTYAFTYFMIAFFFQNI